MEERTKHLSGILGLESWASLRLRLDDGKHRIRNGNAPFRLPLLRSRGKHYVAIRYISHRLCCESRHPKPV